MPFHGSGQAKRVACRVIDPGDIVLHVDIAQSGRGGGGRILIGAGADGLCAGILRDASGPFGDGDLMALHIERATVREHHRPVGHHWQKDRIRGALQERAPGDDRRQKTQSRKAKGGSKRVGVSGGSGGRHVMRSSYVAKGRGGTTCSINWLSQSPSTTKCAVAPSIAPSIRLWLT